MMDWRSVFFVIGAMISGVAAIMLIPIGYEYLYGNTEDWQLFLIPFFITGGTGVLLTLTNYQKTQIKLGIREAFLLTFLSWIICSFFSGLPIFWLSPNCTFINALFESVSALTTTGFSTLSDLESLPKSLILWRAILQWLGGIGIIVMAITVFPVLRIGGMQLFRSEFSDRSEKILPRVSQIAAGILYAYTLFTILGYAGLSFFGMDSFDAFCHSASAISTGGLSTRSEGLIAFDNTAIEAVLILLMIIGGSTLMLYIRLWQGDYKSVLRDQQLKGYLLMLLFTCASLSICLLLQGKTLLNSLRVGCFIAVSTLTTTGFSLFNYMDFGPTIITFVFLMSFIGGCTGSTAGGIKIFRFQIIASFIRSYLKQLRRPHGVFIPMYQGQKISDHLVASVFSFIGLYLASIAVLSILLSLTGLDFVSALSGAVASIGNIGAGLGNTVGPVSNVDSIHFLSKIFLMFGMILGRLELLTALIFFSPSFWRR
jgi:trk system potassium uptake protein TrkH